ncbi:hypothetical protein [Companilactobacillus farciminis]|uniref:hypothetical protein n=1 Tax=Companilactobacillus farciminis TaxID=1612 RepID=UPI00191616DA|nr:hypothetical protein [Companilactobacillus farciminis]
MKKLIVAFLLGLGLIVANNNPNLIIASSSVGNPSKTETIIISADKLGNNKKYRVYKMKDDKMVATKKSLKTHNSKRLYNWKAQAVKVDGKNWWKIGKNQYFKSTRVNKVHVKKGITKFNCYKLTP